MPRPLVEGITRRLSLIESLNSELVDFKSRVQSKNSTVRAPAAQRPLPRDSDSAAEVATAELRGGARGGFPAVGWAPIHCGRSPPPDAAIMDKILQRANSK
jgi:hypothetical protein